MQKEPQPLPLAGVSTMYDGLFMHEHSISYFKYIKVNKDLNKKRGKQRKRDRL